MVTIEMSEFKFTPAEIRLKPGTCEIGCHLPGHYEAGMRGRIVVEAA